MCLSVNSSAILGQYCITVFSFSINYISYARIRLFVFFFFFQAEDGIRDLTVTGVQTCALPISSEAETFWTDFLRKLARRGLRGVKLVISDAHEGLRAAIVRVLNTSWQRCRDRKSVV